MTRRIPRTEVRWSASADGVPGVVYDASPWGVFFAPNRPLCPKAQVNLALDEVVIRSRVCWNGWSGKHERQGFGLEYMEVNKRRHIAIDNNGGERL